MVKDIDQIGSKKDFVLNLIRSLDIFLIQGAYRIFPGDFQDFPGLFGTDFQDFRIDFMNFLFKNPTDGGGVFNDL